MPESHSPRLAVFDCDGTLVDSQHSIISSMFSAFDARVHPRPEAEAVRQVVGLPLREAMVRLLPDAGPDDHDGLVTSFKEAFTDLRNKGEVHDPLYNFWPSTLDNFPRNIRGTFESWMLLLNPGCYF